MEEDTIETEENKVTPRENSVGSRAGLSGNQKLSRDARSGSKPSSSINRGASYSQSNSGASHRDGELGSYMMMNDPNRKDARLNLFNTGSDPYETPRSL